MNDTVYEIGAGEGIITKELLNKAKNVIAFELDSDLFTKLSKQFQNKKSLELKPENFLTCQLPNYPYKVFSNIPFNITSAIIKKLTQENNSPEYSYLIVQKEAAKKFMGRPLDHKNSQVAVILNSWFQFSVIYEFRPGDFSPKPNVDVVFLEIKKRDKPLIDNKNRNKYEDLITYGFNQFKPNITEGLSEVLGRRNIIDLAAEMGFSPDSKPSDLNIKDWTSLFSIFLNMTEKQQNIPKGSYAKQLKQQEKVEKINRTRVDKNWRNYRPTVA